MKNLTAESGARLTLTVTDAERDLAKKAKADFKEIMKKLDKSVKLITDFKRVILEKHPSQADLKTKYRGRLLRYKRNMQLSFNDFLTATKDAIENLAQISDPDMLRLREILAAEVSELTDGAEAILDLLKDPDRDGFSRTIEQVTAQIEKRQQSIKDVIDNQLFGHIDGDILGKLKISELRFNIKRRARIIKQLARK